MTDKQIIIDGIDVSGCAYFGSTMFPTKNCTMDSEYLHSCESCYCYYKQLKKAMNQIVELNKSIQAKEQECERLKNERTLDLVKQLDQLKFDHAELEKRHNDSFEQFKQLKANNIEALKQLEFVRTLNTVQEAEIRKLSKTLTEIKEIVFPKNQLIITDSPIILKIQQKISECEVE